MRVMLGIAIALPIAAAFCVTYLIMLALEGLRDTVPHRPQAGSVSPKHGAWVSPAQVAA